MEMHSNKARRGRSSIAALCAALLFIHGALAAEWPAPAEEEMVLLELRLGDQVVTDLLTSYRHGNRVMVPLQQVSQLLGINIRTYPTELAAEGSILSKERPFYLDLKKREVTLSGVVKPVTAEAILVGEDDIYVDAQLLGGWLPLQLNVDLFASRVTVLPSEELPFQSRLAREQRGSNQPRPQMVYGDPGYPRRDTPYQLITAPTIDQTFSLQHQHAPDVGSDTAFRYTTFATLDLLYMESALFLTGSNNDPLEEYRITLGRRDPEAQLLGPLHATEFAFGGIGIPGVPLLDRAQSIGDGIMVSNRPLSLQNQFDSHSFRGNLAPGWDVELYHNDSLLAFQRSRPDGLYNFDSVPLLYGMNYFKLVFYGPYGERRTEEHRFMLGQSLTPQGQFNYRLFRNRDQDGQPHSLADFDLGLSRQLSLNAGFASLPLEGGQRDYSRFGVRAFLSGFSLFTDSARSQAGGVAHRGGIQSRIGSLGIGWNHTYLSPEFVSTEFQVSSDPIHHRDELRLDSAIPPGWLPRIPISLQMDRDRFYSGESHTEIINRISSYIAGLAITNQLRWDLYSNAPSITDGSFQMSSRLQRYGVRAALLYTLQPEQFWNSLNLSMEGPLTNTLRFNADFIRAIDTNLNTYSIGINRFLGSFALGSTLSYTSQDELTFYLTLSAGIGREPRQPNWLSSALPMARTGTSSLSVFLDNNLNGIRDEGDKPLSGIGFSVNGSTPPPRTDSNGVLFLTDLPIYQKTDLAIATDTLEDPLWIPQLRGIRFTPRPGHTTQFDFPVTVTGEIDGSVYLKRGNRKEELADVEVELVDGNGKVVQTITSAFDGFFLLSAVHPGSYTLRVNQEQLQKYKLQGVAPLPVKINNSGSFISGMNIVLTPTEGAAVVTNLLPQASPVPDATLPAPVTSTAASIRDVIPVDSDGNPYYIVQEGDWLWKIARTLYGDPHYAHEILQLNRDVISDPNQIQPGTRLRLPLQRYTVKKNDWLWKIARRRFGQGERAVEIRDLNRNVITDPNIIQPGQLLLLPPINHD